MKLSTEKIWQIESIAGTVLQDSYSDTSILDIDLPVDLKRILSYHGLNLRTANFDGPILKDVAGVFSREDRTIYIPENESYQRNAFTIAHEIGHYILHKDMVSEIFYRHQADLLRQVDGEIKTAEAEANWFAASLLMPIELIKKYKVIYSNSPEKLSIIFGVSKEAIYWRLKNIDNLTLSHG